MKIGFDFDGVFSNCGKLKSDGVKKLYGIDIPSEKFDKDVVRKKYLTKEQHHRLSKTIYETRELFLLMEPVNGVIQYFPKIVAGNHTIVVITARSGIGLEIAKEWSIKHGLKLDFIGVGHGNSKANAATGLDLYVDDDLSNLESLVNIVPNRFLFSWGYNAHVDVGTFAKRVASWKEIYNAINLIEGD